jgi:hypothetical protein
MAKTQGWWEWRDYASWKSFDAKTASQLEQAWLIKSTNVRLNKGYFASAPAVYHVDMSKPGAWYQINVKTRKFISLPAAAIRVD